MEIDVILIKKDDGGSLAIGLSLELIYELVFDNLAIGLAMGVASGAEGIFTMQSIELTISNPVISYIDQYQSAI